MDTPSISVNGTGGYSSPLVGGVNGGLAGFQAGGPWGALAGAAVGVIGANQTNKANARATDQARQWQEKMRATQYQTAVADLKAAGLNPMLAYTQGGAGNLSTTPAKVENSIAPAMSNAVQALSTAGTLEQLGAQIKNLEADTRNKQATTSNIDAQTEESLARAQVARAVYRSEIGRGLSTGVQAQIDEATKDDTINMIRTELKLRQLAVPEAQAGADFWSGPAGDFGKYLHGAKSIVDMLPGLGSLIPGKKSSGLNFDRPARRVEPYLRGR